MKRPADIRRQLVADIYSSMGRAVYGYILKRTGSPADAEDLLQDVFLNLLQCDTIISKHSITRLIYRIAGDRLAPPPCAFGKGSGVVFLFHPGFIMRRG